ncbi:hypothetical protein I551_1172 [Mycobacterium ulcerans str. Harvey]|uniref:Uncharacterized protein n=1 Tax=Mycobacterium ulcerans str. Harvey TaxID=1299332 RepID=A0ABN0R5J6_MYCUL|nr:hypothetical protein I551_1172 [Mycobacterium ulcerans str. Harvey]
MGETDTGRGRDPGGASSGRSWVDGLATTALAIRSASR